MCLCVCVSVCLCVCVSVCLCNFVENECVHSEQFHLFLCLFFRLSNVMTCGCNWLLRRCSFQAAIDARRQEDRAKVSTTGERHICHDSKDHVPSLSEFMMVRGMLAPTIRGLAFHRARRRILLASLCERIKGAFIVQAPKDPISNAHS